MGCQSNERALRFAICAKEKGMNMETWQRDHITKNLFHLLENTICSSLLYAALQSYGVLSKLDKELIESKTVSTDKADQLYTILQTRSGGYSALIKSLNQTHQTGAVSVLMTGFPLTLIQDRRVFFLGKIQRLQDVLSDTQLEYIKLNVFRNTTVEEYLDFCEQSQESEEYPLLSNTFPPTNTLYIPRFLVKRIFLDSKIFVVESPDVFVVTHEDLHHVEAAAGDVIFKSFTSQLKKITGKFIELELEDDLEQLKSVCKTPLHRVSYCRDTNEFKLLESTGGSQILHKYTKSKTLHSETRVHESDIHNNPENRRMCVIGSPGIGKSTVLESLARIASKRFPERIVGFINLPALAHFLLKNHHAGVTELLSRMLTATKFGAAILNEILATQPVNVMLFFDALDEVSTTKRGTVISFLKRVCNQLPTVSITVTARTHLQAELENTLGVISWDVEPFTHQNKIFYLTSSWMSGLSEFCPDKLHQFANAALKAVNSKLSNNDKIFLGIPMLCKLIGEVLAADARTYCHPKRNASIDTSEFVNSLYEIYEKFFTSKLGVSPCQWKCVFGDTHVTQYCSDVCDIFKFHSTLALQKTFAQNSREVREEFNFNQIDEELVLLKGIITKHEFNGNEKQFVFVHQTFAEYLTACFIVNSFTIRDGNLLSSRSWLNNLYKEVFRLEDRFGILPMFTNPQVVYFVDSFLQKRVESFQGLTNLHAWLESCYPENICDIAMLCIMDQYSSLLEVILTVHAKRKCILEFIEENWMPIRDFKVEKNSVSLVLFYKFIKTFGIDVAQCGYNFLEAAIKNICVEAVEYFLGLHHTLDFLFCESKIIAVKGPTERCNMAQIVRRLITQHPYLILFSNWTAPFTDKKKYLKFVISLAALISNHDANFLEFADFLELGVILTVMATKNYSLFSLPFTFLDSLFYVVLTKDLGFNIAFKFLNFFTNLGVPSKFSDLVTRFEAKSLCDVRRFLKLCVHEFDRNFNGVSNSNQLTKKGHLNSPFRDNTTMGSHSHVHKHFNIQTVYTELALGNNSNFLQHLVTVLDSSDFCRVANSIANVVSSEVLPDLLRWGFAAYKDEKVPSLCVLENLTVNANTLDLCLVAGLSSNWTPRDYTVNINKVDATGWTGIHWAIYKRTSLEHLKHMHDQGANFNVKTVSGETLADFCIKHVSRTSTFSENLYMFSALLQTLKLGENCNESNEQGNNFLQCVLQGLADKKYQSFLKELYVDLFDACFIHNINLHHVNKKNDTVYDIAKRHYTCEPWIEMLNTYK